ncbi:hypothetical protein D9M71_298790 [compost metagenome]
MGPLRRQAEDIRGQLHGSIALGTTTGYPQPGHWRAGAFLDPLLALAQRIGQAFEDGAVDMRTGMHVTKADDRTLGLQPWLADAR